MTDAIDIMPSDLIGGEIVAGVDIGGTNTAVGFVGEDGRVILRSTFPTGGRGTAGEFVDLLSRTIRWMAEKLPSHASLRAIGMAAPAADGRTGMLESPANLNWGSVDLAAMVRERFDLPVAITNDANAALLGEMYYGAAQGMSNVTMITLGTGLGVGAVINGALVLGAHGAAGEFGHITMAVEGRYCGCGRRGCAETYVSAPGLRRTVFELLALRLEESALRHISFSSLTAEDVSKHALQGDTLATEAFNITGWYLGRLIADVALAFDPEAVILFGGLMNAGDLLVVPARRSFEEHALAIARGRIRILVSALNDGRAAILGASRLVRDALLEQCP
jgi:glucokinase